MRASVALAQVGGLKVSDGLSQLFAIDGGIE
jgi:hypothetical protein